MDMHTIFHVINERLILGVNLLRLNDSLAVVVIISCVIEKFKHKNIRSCHRRVVKLIKIK